MPSIHVLPNHVIISVPEGTNLLQALQENGVFLDAPCGGKGRCGKCVVSIQGEDVLSCRVTVENSITVTIPP